MEKDSRKIEILVIEDNPGDYFLVEEYLAEQFEYANLTHVKTYEEAGRLLTRSRAGFDAVLLDLSLPDNRGEQLVEDILSIAKNMPVIILTGYADLSFSMKSLSKGISDYLLKDELSPTLLYKSIIYSIERNIFSGKILASEKKYRNLFELSPQPMFVLDMDTYRFLDVNRAAVTHYGYSKEEFLKMGNRHIMPGEDRKRFEKILEETRDSEKTTDAGVFRHRKKNGEFLYAEIVTSIIDYQDKKARIILADDVTEKRKEQERLKLLESVITNTTEAVVILEAVKSGEPGRKILYVNEAFTDITGYQPDEVLGKTLHFLNGPKTAISKRRKLGAAMDKWEICEVEMINYKKDGSEFWINTSLVPVADGKGGYSHWVAIGREISDRKEYETRLEESIQEQEVLLSEIHHRVKNNLAVVSGMMQLQVMQDEERPEVRRRLYDSIFRIQTMATIHELLYESNSFSRLRFSDVVEKLVYSIEEVLNHDKEIRIDITSEPIDLNVNQAIPCSLILNEVVTNIFKHAFHGKETGEIRISLSLSGDRIFIRVRDNGTGVPGDFDYKTEGSLGMHIIRILSQQLDASYQISGDRKGTLFTMEFVRTNVRGAASALVME